MLRSFFFEAGFLSLCRSRQAAHDDVSHIVTSPAQLLHFVLEGKDAKIAIMVSEPIE